MSKKTRAHPLPSPLTDEEHSSLIDSTDRLSTASDALNGFSDLLSGMSPRSPMPKAESMASLIEPIRYEIREVVNALHDLHMSINNRRLS